MEYNYMELTVKISGRRFFHRVENEHNSYIVALHRIIDSVYKHAGDDFGIILEDDIEREMKENGEDEDYTPFPTLDTFKELGEELVVSGAEVFPMRYQFADLRDFVNYVEYFPLDVVKVNYYNRYTLEGERLYSEIFADEFSDYFQSLICEIQCEIKDDDLYNALDTIDTDKDEAIVLNEINQTLARYGYKLTEMIP